MTIPTIELEIKKDGLQQKQDGTWTLKLTVNGEDMKDCPILSAPMGQRYLCVLVELTDDDEEAAHRKADKTARHLVGTQEKDETAQRLELIPGTGITVGAIRRFHEDGYTVEGIVEEYPTLTEEQVKAALKPAKQAWDDMPLSKQAGMKCKDPLFQQHIAKLFYSGDIIPTPDDIKKYGDFGALTAVHVRRYCGVKSLSQLAVEPMAGERWERLYSEYQEAMGLVAQDRS